MSLHLKINALTDLGSSAFERVAVPHKATRQLITKKLEPKMDDILLALRLVAEALSIAFGLLCLVELPRSVSAFIFKWRLIKLCGGDG